MKILFDIELNLSEQERETLFDSKLGQSMIQIREMLEDRFKSLRQEVEWQNGQMVIHISDTQQVSIDFQVTAALKFKLERLIKADDYRHVSKLLLEATR